MTYTHLTREERYQIYALKKAGHKQYEIAELLERSKSTISRELARNCGGRGYRPKQAQGVDRKPVVLAEVVPICDTVFATDKEKGLSISA